MAPISYHTLRKELNHDSVEDLPLFGAQHRLEGQMSLQRVSDTNKDREGVISVDEDEAFEQACRIWFEAPERAAQELSQLTTIEREKVWADLTGTHEISNYEFPKEDPAVIQLCFVEFRSELHIYKSRYPSKPLGQVLHNQPDYVLTPTFMIKYLRASDYNAKSALALMVRHFDMKYELFGANTLGRDIVLEDLDERDLQFLSQGAYQYLNKRDRAGRAVTFLSFTDQTYASSQKINVLRAMFYRNTIATESESVQRLGIVRIGYFHQSSIRGGVDNDLLRLSVRIIEAVPIRCVAMYLVSGSNVWSNTMDLIVMLAGPFLRVRMRIVNGSFYENLYTLLCLGIPQNAIPAGEDGRVSTKHVLKWIEARRAIEESRIQACDNSDDTTTPLPMEED